MKMSARGSAPKFGTWVVCLVLFVVALAVTFGVIQPGARLLPWTWIIGYGLLLVACRYRGL